MELPKLDTRRKIFGLFLGSYESRSLDRFALASEGLSGSDIRQICETARRSAVVHGLEGVSESDVLRRLLLQSVNGENLSVPELVVKAKQSLPQVYTHRILASILDMSPGNVSHILKRLKEA
jgi:SpoVK/Ycf46/Vps4 family AAA+-type ATPase